MTASTLAGVMRLDSLPILSNVFGHVVEVGQRVRCVVGVGMPGSRDAFGRVTGPNNCAGLSECMITHFGSFIVIAIAIACLSHDLLIWKMPKLWVGFLKCAAQTQPRSFDVLLQLPSLHLESALNRHPNLRTPLAAYANQPNLRTSLPWPLGLRRFAECQNRSHSFGSKLRENRDSGV
ncbi:hypothetical protein ZIOFF_015526 [Zingiber officinale]|uniref:Symplekin C-terminal domain-containing protein n=1 Tax=Zingiber officinale TaxID=94328 RepID=A0A8J5HRA8_ZINOF|nr:hypothetical protein ZIOFF_015526 [Zingiber officinale]